MTQHFPAIVTLLTLFLLLATGISVGIARKKFSVKAPATTGNDDFERVFRVQMNTQENTILFLPALWLFSSYISPLWAGVVGLVWLLARVHYAISYSRSAAARAPGFAIGMFAFITLAGGASIGIGMRFFSGV